MNVTPFFATRIHTFCLRGSKGKMINFAVLEFSSFVRRKGLGVLWEVNASLLGVFKKVWSSICFANYNMLPQLRFFYQVVKPADENTQETFSYFLFLLPRWSESKYTHWHWSSICKCTFLFRLHFHSKSQVKCLITLLLFCKDTRNILDNFPQNSVFWYLYCYQRPWTASPVQIKCKIRIDNHKSKAALNSFHWITWKLPLCFGL